MIVGDHGGLDSGGVARAASAAAAAPPVSSPSVSPPSAAPARPLRGAADGRARYLEARDKAYTAWANSQPQYVIPGLLDQTQHNGPGRSTIQGERGRGHWRSV